MYTKKSLSDYRKAVKIERRRANDDTRLAQIITFSAMIGSYATASITGALTSAVAGGLLASAVELSKGRQHVKSRKQSEIAINDAPRVFATETGIRADGTIRTQLQIINGDLNVVREQDPKALYNPYYKPHDETSIIPGDTVVARKLGVLATTPTTMLARGTAPAVTAAMVEAPSTSMQIGLGVFAIGAAMVGVLFDKQATETTNTLADAAIRRIDNISGVPDGLKPEQR